MGFTFQRTKYIRIWKDETLTEEISNERLRAFKTTKGNLRPFTLIIICALFTAFSLGLHILYI